MEPARSVWGHFGPVQYAPSATRVLTDHHYLAHTPFVRTPDTTKDDLRAAIHKNLWTVYESLWRLWSRKYVLNADLQPEARTGARQGAAAFVVDDLLPGIESLGTYWARNVSALFTEAAPHWERIARIRTVHHGLLVLRMRPGAPVQPALWPVYAALWQAVGFGDADTARARGHYWVLNTSNLPGATLREKALAWKALPAAWRARFALYNDDIRADQLVALCTKFGIRAVLDVTRAADATGKRVTQDHPLFASVRDTWCIESHATRYYPGFAVFVRDPPDARAVVDRYLKHYTTHDARFRWTAPAAICVPAYS